MYQNPPHQLDHAITVISDFLDLYSQWAKQQGWLPNEFFALYSIAHHPNCGQKDIADDWCLPKQTVFSVCQQLIKKGLIVATASTNDKRQKILQLTPMGKTQIVPMLDKLKDIEQATICQFGEAKLQQLTQDIKTLSQLLFHNLELSNEKQSCISTKHLGQFKKHQQK